MIVTKYFTPNLRNGYTLEIRMSFYERKQTAKTLDPLQEMYLQAMSLWLFWKHIQNVAVGGFQVA